MRRCVLSTRIVIPIHYAFNGGVIADHLLLKYDGTAEEFARTMARMAPATQVRILAPGEPLAVPARS